MSASQSRETTASTCAAKTACGTHFFKIEGYSLYRGLGVGNSVQSATFAVGGYDWCLSFYPDGYDNDSQDYVSVFLALKTANTKVRALYDMTLIISQGTQPPLQPFTWPNPWHIEPVVFDYRGEWGYAEFVKKSDLKEYILDDTILIECNIAVIKFMEAQVQGTKMKSEVQVPQSDLLDNLSDLLEAHEGADVSFEVEGQVFPAHKIILAMRSPVFKAEFYGPMRNKCGQSVTIEDMQPAVFKALLHFINTDSLPPMDDLNDDEHEAMFEHLLAAADRYAMERMKLMCERELSKNLYADTVAATLALADQHHSNQLKDACIDFINSSDKMDDVVASKGYEHLKRACPMIFADIWEKAAKIRKM
jgi:speckle-type POZ protein